MKVLQVWNDMVSNYRIKIFEFTIPLKQQFVTFGALAVNKQNCVRLAEEHCSRSYFSLFMSMMNHAGTGLLHSVTYPNQSKIVRI